MKSLLDSHVNLVAIISCFSRGHWNLVIFLYIIIKELQNNILLSVLTIITVLNMG